MNFTELNIRRPVMTTLVMIGILIFGIMAYLQLPVSDLPTVDFPTVVVQAALPGASPETMATSVAQPLERIFSTIASLDQMSSTNTQGFTQITLTFNLNRKIDAAAQDVQSAISQVLGQLPADMPTPPSYMKVNPADQPILYLAVTSSVLPMSAVNEAADTTMSQRISTVPGVARVQIYGAQKYAARIQLDPKALASRGIGIDEVVRAIQAANVNLPTGTLTGRYQAYVVQAEGQLKKASEYLPIIVAYRNAAPVYLRDIGTAFDSVENDKTVAWYGDAQVEQNAIVLAVQRQPGSNTVEVADAVKALLPAFKKQLPSSISIHTLFDRSESIRESVHDVKFTLLLTLALVVLVIFLFIRNVSATVIPSLALPMSVIGTFTVMYALNYSLDNLSLMALTLAVGFVVDDAIVVLENIVRHMDMGKRPMRAALDGAAEIGFTVLSMTLSLAAVFIPIVFMPGLIGRLFQEFAVVIGVAVLVSGFVSLTLTPMLCSRFLRHSHQVHHGAVYRASEAVFDGMLKFYEVTLGAAIRHRRITMGVALLVLAGIVGLFKLVTFEFMPSEDRALFFARTEAAQGVSFRDMADHQHEVNNILRADPNIESFMSIAAMGQGMGASNSGFVVVKLKPRAERAMHVDQVIESLRPRLDAIPGLKAYPQNPASLNTSGRMTKAKYQYTLQGPEAGQIYPLAAKMVERMVRLDGFLDVNSDVELKNPQVNITIDRNAASRYGVSAEQIQGALYNAYGSRQISTIYTATNQYKVELELLPQYQEDPNKLSMLYVRSSHGDLVPLNVLTTRKTDVGPLSINHSGQLTSVTLSFNLRPDVAESVAAAKVEALAREILPATVSGNFGGDAQAMQQSTRGLFALFVVAVLVIYLVLGILYESFLHPVTILSALPLALFGAMLTLLLFNVPVSIYAFVGIIMLVGLVKKNGIMMVDFAIEARKSGATPAEAICQASLVRFRPIMMTTMAALMGTLPIAIGWGAGAETRRPLGLAVVGGLLFSQTLTLYVTPVFYIYMEKFSNWLGRVFNVRHDRPDEPEPVSASLATTELPDQAAPLVQYAAPVAIEEQVARPPSPAPGT